MATKTPGYRPLRSDEPAHDFAVEEKERIEVNPTPKYQDLWATVLFVSHFVVLFALAHFGYRRFEWKELPGKGDPFPEEPGQPTYPGEPGAGKPIGNISGLRVLAHLIMLFGSGFCMSGLYLSALQRYAGGLIWTSFILNIVLFGALAILPIVFGVWPAAIIPLVIVLIHLILFRQWRARIPFAKVVLETVTSVTAAYPATFAVAVVGLVASSISGTVWVIAALGSYQLVAGEEADKAARYAASFFLLLSFMWTSQVIKNVVHVTVSGVFATFYFTGIEATHSPTAVIVPVHNPTLASARRALTTSFGPIAFGSLILAFIQTLKQMARQIGADARANNNNILAIASACFQCLFSVIESALAYLNKYAFTQVAVYGKPYCEAARDTWELIKYRGIDMVINDDIVGSVLVIGAIGVGLVTTLVSFGYFSVMGGSVQESAIFGGFAAVFAFAQFGVMAEVINAGVATTFTCLAMEPEALRRTKPALYERVQESYRDIQLAESV